MLIEPVLVDAGALIALYEARDPLHKACVEQAKLLPVGKAYTCWPVITEAVYRLRKYRSERRKLLEAVRDGIYILLPLDADDIPGLDAVMTKYDDQQVDLADACLVHLANRESIEAVFTTDRRHFQVYRKADGKPFRLLPAP
ncbi:MAG: PIN domain-containing protein [Bythopirellula sp.]|nr:PIN domain-containing protein [Bythopirellula sp.]